MSIEFKSPKEKPAGPHSKSSLWEAIARSTPEDYDGHTEFERLSPSDRLAWLETAVQFIGSVQRDRIWPQPPN